MLNILKDLTAAKSLIVLVTSAWVLIIFSLYATTNVWAAEQTSPSENGSSTSTEPQPSCHKSDVITMGYKYGEGANPFALIGRCIKLKNVTPIQYMSAQKALVSWNHRGEQGTVFVEDKSETGLSINNAKILIGRSVGTYEYRTVLGSKVIVPHLVIE